MTKEQGWIIVALVAAMFAFGLVAFVNYSNQKHEEKGQMIAACLNKCNFVSGDPKADSCVLVCAQEKGIDLEEGEQQKLANQNTNIKPDTRVESTTVRVSTFYNGENGYSLSIPSGNDSTCIWNWTGGNAAIPFSETTYANTAMEKHVLSFGRAPNGDAVEIEGVGYDWKVTCLDDFGNQYTGVFPN